MCCKSIESKVPHCHRGSSYHTKHDVIVLALHSVHSFSLVHNAVPGYKIEHCSCLNTLSHTAVTQASLFEMLGQHAC